MILERDNTQPSEIVALFVTSDTSDIAEVGYCYALIDPAQDGQILDALRHARTHCFLGDASAVREVSPHLVELPSGTHSLSSWNKLIRRGKEKPCALLLRSNLSFDRLFSHFLDFLDVQVNDSTTMLLAWWDAAILASLLGQPNDKTLHERGPVFTAQQRRAFVDPLIKIGYWDRTGQLQVIKVKELDETVPALSSEYLRDSVLPLKFSADQVRLLVKATTPDQVLHELRLNQPGVLSDRSEWENYRMTCNLVDAARNYGIVGLQDMVNFTGAGMILGEEFYLHPKISGELAAIQESKRSFSDVLKSLPPDLLLQAKKWKRID
ncbi:DUF4123 domain-containing protein [Xanthomonas cerealis pv. cerealis]|uniref:DUF4123 domain-containing protein n=1 Tax=Xanthomonas cerealis TaxID=3390025 RepID=UPI001F249B53|nr:DUF4123 domain-containing protein [Xanthomonas translucens]UKE70989.1 DUF4123 domain-containing protein [Xanthomonas translucens pv. pistacia]